MRTFAAGRTGDGWAARRNTTTRRSRGRVRTAQFYLAQGLGSASSHLYNPALVRSCFLRTYSARIYSIETNSSLACLHMPHPSNPVDDTSARSFNRELSPCLQGVEDVRLGGASCLRASVLPCLRVARLSDGLPSSRGYSDVWRCNMSRARARGSSVFNKISFEQSFLCDAVPLIQA